MPTLHNNRQTVVAPLCFKFNLSKRLSATDNELGQLFDYLSYSSWDVMGGNYKLSFNDGNLLGPWLSLN